MPDGCIAPECDGRPLAGELRHHFHSVLEAREPLPGRVPFGHDDGVRRLTAVVPLLLLAGCSASEPAEPEADPCQDARTAAEEYDATAVEALDAMDDAQRRMDRNTVYGTDASVPDAFFTAKEDRERHAAEARSNVRLWAQVVVGNPSCFDAESRAEAEEVLTTVPVD